LFGVIVVQLHLQELTLGYTVYQGIRSSSVQWPPRLITLTISPFGHLLVHGGLTKKLVLTPPSVTIRVKLFRCTTRRL